MCFNIKILQIFKAAFQSETKRNLKLMEIILSLRRKLNLSVTLDGSCVGHNTQFMALVPFISGSMTNDCFIRLTRQDLQIDLE